MNLHSIPALMMSAVCLYVAFYYFIMYSLRRHERGYLTFALSCLSVFIYDITCAGLYNANNIEAGVFWQRGNFISTSLVSVSLVWFISDFTNSRIGKRATALTLYFLVMIPFFIFTDTGLLLTAANPSIKQIKIDSLINITYYEADPGIFCTVFLLVTIFTFIYMILILVRYNRINKDRRAIKIIVSFCIFFAGVFNDILVSSGVYNFIYISEYIFMYILMIMGYALYIKFVELQQEVENLNINLEHKIAERTIELIEKQYKTTRRK